MPTSIMDAFNAAAHFSRQSLSYMDEENRKEADAWLRNVPAKFSTDIQNRIRDNPFNYTGNPDDPEELENYTRQYMGKFINYAREWYAKETGGKAAVPYIRRQIEQMQTNALESLRDYALGKQDEWRIQREHVSRDEDNQRYLDALKNGTFTPEQALTAIWNRLDLSGKRIGINPQKMNEMRRAYETAAYQSYAAIILGQVQNVNELPAAMQRVRDAFAFMPKTTLNVYGNDGEPVEIGQNSEIQEDHELREIYERYEGHTRDEFDEGRALRRREVEDQAERRREFYEGLEGQTRDEDEENALNRDDIDDERKKLRRREIEDQAERNREYYEGLEGKTRDEDTVTTSRPGGQGGNVESGSASGMTAVSQSGGNVARTLELPWSFEGKDEWERALIQQETNRIQKRNEDRILADDAVYRALMDKAARGETTAAWEANRLAEPYRNGVQSDLLHGREVIEYSDSFKDRIPGLFGARYVGGSEGGSRAGAGKGSPKLDLSSFDYSIYKLYEGIVLGTAGISLYQLSDGKGENLIAPLKAEIWALAEAGDPIHQENRRWIEQNGDSALLSHIGFSVLENPEKYFSRLVANNAGAARYLSNDCLSVIRAEAKKLGRNFDSGLNNGELNQEQLFHMWNLIRDCAREDRNGLTDTEYIKLIDRELTLIVANGVADSRRAKAGNEASMAKAMWQWQQDTNAVYTFGDETPRYRNEAFRRDAEEWVVKELERLSGKIGEALKFVRYDQEPGTQSDIRVKGIYEDMNHNQYRSVAVSNDNGRHVTIRDEWRPILPDGSFGPWRTYGARDRSGTTASAQSAQTRQPTATEAARERALDEAQARSTFVPNEKIPTDRSGKPLADWQTMDNGLRVQYLQDWSKDQNRPSEQPAGMSIPADKWKTQWRSMTPEERLKILFKIYGRN